MSGFARVSLFAGLLVLVFAGAALAGGAIEPSAPDKDGEERASGGHGNGDADEHGAEQSESEPSEGSSTPPGLQVADDRYRLVVERRRLDRGASVPVRFQILGTDGRPVRDFEVEHDKRMHLIIVRRDLSGFQHLHPEMHADGTWEGRARLSSGGTYRVFADFKVAGAKRTLGTDVHVAGTFQPESLPRPALTARTQDGLEVTMKAADAHAGNEERVEFEVRRDGRVVDEDLQPYLGAKGHLVALRDGDLAYLHTHPESDELAFMATYPTAGAYRLFVQFMYRGRVQTAEFTVEVSR